MSVSAPGTVELLAPAGEPRALRAALAAGADAIYFGLESWSARAFAGNFAGEAVVEAIETAHLYGARAYVALNTLLKDAEIETALAALAAPHDAGLDAVIVADLAFLARAREKYPALPIHASTQLNTHSSAQIDALLRLGCARAILARELSLEEIAALDRGGLELEAFVHGALCYGYSGDCLLSSMIGGRSGNRGRCSQSCRLRYALRCGQTTMGAAPVLPDRAGCEQGGDEAPRRVLSTADLAAIKVLPELLAAGVTSFKIEGRMKDAAYVAVTTAVYREALDAALAVPSEYSVRPEWLARLEQSFSRGFTTAHLEGRHHEVRSAGRGGHRGVLVGRVARVDEAGGEVEVKLARPVMTGDLVYFYTPYGQTEPVRLVGDGETTLRLRVGERVAVKDRLFRLAAAEAGTLALDLVTGRVVLRPILLRMRLEGEVGSPPRLVVASPGPEAMTVTIAGGVDLAAARTAALDAQKARSALGALGGTPYRLADLEYAVTGNVFLPVGELKELRRRALAELDERRVAARRRAVQPAASGSRHRRAREPIGDETSLPAARQAVAVEKRGLDVVLVVRPGEPPLPAPDVCAICVDVWSEDRMETVATALDDLSASGLPVRLRLPEVLFDEDEGWWRALLALPWQGLYARHLGLLPALRDARAAGPLPYILEYPLQGLNGGAAAVAAALVGRPPAAVVVSPEASLTEIAGLVARLVGDGDGDVRERSARVALEVLAVGRQQLLRTRDQLGRAEGILPESDGPAHVPLVLADAKGYEFPVLSEAAGARIFNARLTNVAGVLDDLVAAGVSAGLVVQSDLGDDERAAFVAGGLRALAPFVTRTRTTTAHLFRGVA